MALKKLKPTSAGQRFRSTSTFEEITATKPEKSLVVSFRKTGGRNNQGHRTIISAVVIKDNTVSLSLNAKRIRYPLS